MSKVEIFLGAVSLGTFLTKSMLGWKFSIRIQIKRCLQENATNKLDIFSTFSQNPIVK